MQTFDVSGVADAIGSVFDIIFQGFLGPIDEALGENQLIGVKLGLAIILYFLISTVISKRFDEKISKIMSAIISIMFVMLVPEELLETIFVDFVGGLLTLALLLALIYFPTRGIYKWSKDNVDDKFTQWMAALSQFLLLLMIIWVFGNIVSSSTQGGDFGNIVVAFGVLISFILVIIYIGRAFSGTMAGEKIVEKSRESYQKGKEWREERKEKKKPKDRVNKIMNAISSYLNDIRKLHRGGIKSGKVVKLISEVNESTLVEMKRDLNEAFRVYKNNESELKSYFADDVVPPNLKELDDDLRGLGLLIDKVVKNFDNPSYSSKFKDDVNKMETYYGKIEKDIKNIRKKL